MSDTYTIPETVTVDSSLVIEALAAIWALGQLDSEVAAHAAEEAFRLDTAATDFAGAMCTRLSDAVFGPIPDSIEATEFPVEVELWARAAEMTAKILREHVALETGSNPLLRRADAIEKDGQAMREAGTIIVSSPRS